MTFVEDAMGLDSASRGGEIFWYADIYIYGPVD